MIGQKKIKVILPEKGVLDTGQKTKQTTQLSKQNNTNKTTDSPYRGKSEIWFRRSKIILGSQKLVQIKYGGQDSNKLIGAIVEKKGEVK